jgi:hypothetical protein
LYKCGASRGRDFDLKGDCYYDQGMDREFSDLAALLRERIAETEKAIEQAYTIVEESRRLLRELQERRTPNRRADSARTSDQKLYRHSSE